MKKKHPIAQMLHPHRWWRIWRVWWHDPRLLRRMLRDNAGGQIFLCMLLSVLVSGMVSILHRTVLLAHRVAFDLPPGEHLSSGDQTAMERIWWVPGTLGLAVGLFYLVSKLFKLREIVDPIEANAIYGGRMSMRDSLRLLVATLLSNVAGASIGMEAAYTQVGASILSWFGQRLHLRREDMRILVAAGSAAAIAAAFNAPLAGAFYGFELVLGSYVPAALPQVSIAALTGALSMRLVNGNDPIFVLPQEVIEITQWQFPLFILLGVITAWVGIGTMKAVTRCEHWARNMRIPGVLRPALGGMVLSLMALAFPQILGNGQGAINYHFNHHGAVLFLMALLAAKIAGSAVSIGMGFRGGMFSSSLFIGCLVGQIFGSVISYVVPASQGLSTAFMLVGVGAMGASIIGAPLTMTLLVLEMTGNFEVTTGVLAGVIVASAITRYSFGYSFSTWRFHLRGLRILGGHDVGWVKEMTVGKLMRTGMEVVDAGRTWSDLRKSYTPGSVKRLFVVDAKEGYKGTIEVIMLHGPAPEDTAITAGRLAKDEDAFLTPAQDIQSALRTFAEAELEELPVIEGPPPRAKLVGYLTEAYALRRYNQELEAHSLTAYGTGGPGDSEEEAAPERGHPRE